jgi:hypothetical protein
MVEPVKVLPQAIQDIIEVRIWNVKERQGTNRIRELGARVVPCIALNGEVVFQACIPPPEELITAISQRLSR